MTYSAQIKQIRLNAGLTQMQMAEKVGVSFATVNRWENGRAKPSPLALRRVKEINSLPKGHPFLCEHANECPVDCPCGKDCYCRQPGNTCGRNL